MFRHPVLSATQYVELYQQGNPTQWSGIAEREDHRHIRSLVMGCRPKSKLLDVGCGTGDFLVSLPEEIQRFGIEPSDSAAQARSRGIDVLTRQIGDLPVGAQFNLITIIDVIEHVVDPAALLIEAYARLVPGGKIIVSTGDPQNSMWRRVWKSNFWYVSFPEHLTFPSIGFWDNWCSQNGAVMAGRLRFRYRLLSVPQIALSIIMQVGFYFSPAAFSWAGRMLVRLGILPASQRRAFSPGIAGLFLDHQIVVIEKPGF
jgi:SAM-dependent methyltransferase